MGIQRAPTPAVHEVNGTDLEILPPEIFSERRDIGPKKEKPVHRTIAYLLLKGNSQREVAEIVGCGEVTISKLCSAKWFKQLLATLAQLNGGSEVQALMQGAASGAALVLIEQLNAKDEKVRQSAATQILDRSIGKPAQRIIQSKEVVPVDPRDELELLNREIAELTAKATARQTSL